MPIEFELGLVQEKLNQSYGQHKITSYYHDKDHVIERIDLANKKLFYPKYKKDNDWVYGTDGYWVPYIPASTYTKGVILSVEGQKVVDYMTKSSFTAFTPSIHCWTEKGVSYVLEFIKERFEGIVVIPDNDPTGEYKASLMQKEAWKIQIPCNIIPIKDIWDNFENTIEIKKGSDMADLNFESNKLKAFMEEYVRKQSRYRS